MSNVEVVRWCEPATSTYSEPPRVNWREAAIVATGSPSSAPRRFNSMAVTASSIAPR